MPSLLAALSMIVSVALLGLALKTLPVGTACVIWTGIGGIWLMGDPANAARFACIALIIGGILGLKAAS